MASSAAGREAATTSGDRARIMSGMSCLDTSRNPRIPILMEMVAGLSRARSPHDVLDEFRRGFLQITKPAGYMSLSTRDLEPGDYRITRWPMPLQSFNAENADPWTETDPVIHRGGFLGEIIRQAYPEVIHRLHVVDDPVLGDALAAYGSMMVIPLFDEGQPLNWAINLREEPEGFTITDLEDSILRSNLVGAMVKNTVVTRRLREANEAARREVEQIARIQRSLVPPQLPHIPGARLGVHYEMFDQAGGDLYALRPLDGAIAIVDGIAPEGEWAVLIGDVSGHGPAAAVVMAMLTAMLDTYAAQPAGPGELLEHANRYLSAKQIEHAFVTAFLGFYCPETRVLRYARAGHNPPIVMARDGDDWAMRPLDAVGEIPLGIMPEVAYEEASLQLASGQTLVLYTDGITEAQAPDGEQFGVDGIERSLHHCSGDPDCVIGHVTQAVRDHQRGVRPADDQTLVVMRID